MGLFSRYLVNIATGGRATGWFKCSGGSTKIFVNGPSDAGPGCLPPNGPDPTAPSPDLGDDDHSSPLVLDLGGDGVEANTITYFDHEGDGWSELSRWANEDDGMLVWDRNDDGKINDGSELFGNNTVIGDDGETAGHGFAALVELDSNDDGVVDSNDSDFANGLWLCGN